VIPSEAVRAIIDAGRRLDARGWVPGTAGNISVRLDADTCAITQSGRHKGFLNASDIMAVALDGTPCSPGRPSYETGLHLALYRRFADVCAVLHGHSVPATVLSSAGRPIVFQGYELQKIFAGAPDPDDAVTLPVFDNDQDIARLAARIDAWMEAGAMAQAPMPAGYLLAGHGVYVWGNDMPQALARYEALEFLLACELEISGRTP
jgi:methylthioribulose-1-phosphate dehydratase